MNLIRPIFLSTYPPEQCGLATFTKDSADAVDEASGQPISSVLAIQKARANVAVQGRVVHVLDNLKANAYRNAAEIVNDGPWNTVSLQHEFGLYPGDWGGGVMEFVRHCQKPLISTFHTLPIKPDDLPRRLIHEIAKCSATTIVMTRVAAKLLRSVYGVTQTPVRIVPHGVPTVPFERNRGHREKLGLSGRKVICTFGLINPGKGLESMIRAMPQIVEKSPEAIYYIVGVTHPQVLHHSGETYRQQLAELSASLGVSNNVRFVNEYLNLSELILFLQACDIFVTPYPGKDQIASGTMAYAMASVGAIVSTPYLYAKEVLSEGRGLIVPFSSDEKLAEAILLYLKSPRLMADTRLRAYRYAQSMFWPNVGAQYLDVFNQAANPSHNRSDPSTLTKLKSGKTLITTATPRI